MNRSAIWIIALPLFGGCGVLSSYNIVRSLHRGPVGSLITLRGADFSQAQSVTVGGTPALLVSRSSSTIAAFVMPGTATGPIEVTTPSEKYSAGPFTVTATGIPSAPQGNKLVAKDAGGLPATGGQGTAVAVSADENTAVVGEALYNSGAGGAWIFTRTGGVWTQEGTELVGSGAIGIANQGQSVAISADGQTVLVGGPGDNGNTGAIWAFTRSGGVWTQQGSKVVGTGTVGTAIQGWSVALSADGNTAVTGGPQDNFGAGAAWAFRRSGETWTQQGAKLVGTGSAGAAQGNSVAISADGKTLAIGGSGDNGGIGATWVFNSAGDSWVQQGTKLVGTGVGALGYPSQGCSSALSADGNTLLVGGNTDDANTGATWVFTRSQSAWTQQGPKLVGTGIVGGLANQGQSVAVSADGNAAIVGGPFDNGNAGATWVFSRANGVWTQQGPKLVGSGAVGTAAQGMAVALSANGITAIVGGPWDASGPLGAAWVFVSPLRKR